MSPRHPQRDTDHRPHRIERHPGHHLAQPCAHRPCGNQATYRQRPVRHSTRRLAFHGVARRARHDGARRLPRPLWHLRLVGADGHRAVGCALDLSLRLRRRWPGRRRWPPAEFRATIHGFYLPTSLVTLAITLAPLPAAVVAVLLGERLNRANTEREIRAAHSRNAHPSRRGAAFLKREWVTWPSFARWPSRLLARGQMT